MRTADRSRGTAHAKRSAPTRPAATRSATGVAEWGLATQLENLSAGEIGCRAEVFARMGGAS
jgi:hypothetical protein